MRKQAYLAGEGNATDRACPLCRQEDSGGHTLGVGYLEGLKEIGVHSKRVPAFVLPDRYLHNRGVDPGVERGLLQRGEADSRSKMRPDMIIVEMTAAEQ